MYIYNSLKFVKRSRVINKSCKHFIFDKRCMSHRRSSQNTLHYYVTKRTYRDFFQRRGVIPDFSTLCQIENCDENSKLREIKFT